MKRLSSEEIAVWSALCNGDSGSAALEAKLALLGQLRTGTDAARETDLRLLERLAAAHRALEQSKENIHNLEGIVKKLTAEPWFPAIFLGGAPTRRGALAWVRQGNSDRLVGLAEGVELGALSMGDTVYLGHELNVIIERAPAELDNGGETCVFDRRLADGRMIVRVREEEFVIRAMPQLIRGRLAPGDLLRWNRAAMLAFERLERTQESPFFIENTPRETFADVGGLSHQIEEIKSTLTLHLNHVEIARKYQLEPKGSILLCGPSGTGKTLVAKALANWLAGISPTGRALFMNIKPSALHSMWYSQSEANYREIFRVARETAAANPGSTVVMFFDEVDSVGAGRGASHMRVHDNVLMAFLAELDGLGARGDILVVGATNRPEALDPALARPGRLGDLILEIPRPNRQAAADVFSKHLPPGIPYGRNGCGDDLEATRREIIERAVTRMYAPNSETELATLTFRNNERRPVRMADLVSGAVIAGIARRAVERACLREVNTGQTGVRWEDVALAIQQQFETAVRALTPLNCRQHLGGLPYDLDVVNIEPVARRVSRPQRFLRAA